VVTFAMRVTPHKVDSEYPGASSGREKSPGFANSQMEVSAIRSLMREPERVDAAGRRAAILGIAEPMGDT